MRSKFPKFLPFIIIFFFSFFAQEVMACSCSGIPTPYEAFNESKTVFIGKVVGVTDSLGNEIIKDNLTKPEEYQIKLREAKKVYYRFVVHDLLKGAKTSELKIAYGINMCQFGFDVGGTYLIYAYDSDNTLWTNSFCARNAPIENAQEDIFFIRGLIAKKSEPRIYGSVWLNPKELNFPTHQKTYLKGIKVVAQNQKNRFETFTNNDGLFWFTNIPNGTYKVHPELPIQYKNSWKDSFQITLTKNGESINEMFGQRTTRAAYTEFEVFWNNEIRGKVLDAEGKPLERANVFLIPVSQINNKLIFDRYKSGERFDLENRYLINGQTPGKYVLAVQIFAPFTSGQEKFVMFYPQEFNPEKAEIIDLSGFDKRNIDIKLPAGFVVCEIEGTMFWSSGEPVNKGYVSIEKQEDSSGNNNTVYDYQFIEGNKFKIQIFNNAEYWIKTQSEYKDLDTTYFIWSRPIKIKVSNSNPPIVITIPKK